jgi:hypothetical protein
VPSPPDPIPATYVRLFADDDGESHLEDVVLPAVEAPGEPGVPRLLVHEFGPVDRLQFLDVDTTGHAPGWHTGPRRQFVVFLTGWARIDTSDGDSRTLPAGGAVLVEDVHGHGHVTTHEPGPQKVLVIPLDPPAP